MKIALVVDHFISWGGGIDFIYTIYQGLKHKTENDKKIEIIIFAPIDLKLLKILRFLLGKKDKYDLREFSKIFIEEQIQIVRYLKPEVKRINIVDKGRSLKEALHKNNIDICFPLSDPDIDFEKMDIPYIAYIFDFQHKKIERLFSKKEISSRNEEFGKVLYNAKNVMVNAREVRDDIKAFYPDSNAKIHVLPFSPIGDIDWKNIEVDNIFGNYFMISNQFWIHKDHITAFEAFERLYNQGHKNVKLVCTGKMEDYRDQNYISRLKEKIQTFNSKENIVLLGYIDKEKQIGIMKNAISVIQPTRCEGGPGGGSVYNALALGVPCIVSDIPVNKEIGNEYDVTYFKVGDKDDLANKMIELLNSKKEKLTEEELLAFRANIIEKYSCALYKIIDEVIHGYNHG